MFLDEFGSMEMSLSNAATVFDAPEKTVAEQLCMERPLIVLATMLLSSFQFREVSYDERDMKGGSL